MTTEDDFQKSLDEHPDDWQLRMVFADWLDEQGDGRAEAYRVLGMLRKWPWRLHHDGRYAYHNGEGTATLPKELEANHGRVPQDHALPQEWVCAIAAGPKGEIPKYTVYWGGYWKEPQEGEELDFSSYYAPDRRSAEEEAVFAWQRLTAKQRKRILKLAEECHVGCV